MISREGFTPKNYNQFELLPRSRLTHESMKLTDSAALKLQIVYLVYSKFQFCHLKMLSPEMQSQIDIFLMLQTVQCTEELGTNETDRATDRGLKIRE